MGKLKVFGINLIFLIILVLLSNFSSSQEIELQYPSEVNCGETFSIGITLIDFPADIYDVKIDIKNINGERLSEIFDGDYWHSTYNYVNEAINNPDENSSSFQLNITGNYEGEAAIEVKIRDSSNRAETFTDYTLNIVYGNNTEAPEEEEEQEDDGGEEEEPPEISLKLEWEDDEIINGDEFEIESRAYNLEDKIYEIRALIMFKENDTIISETYYQEDDKWKSSTYYVGEAVTGPGNKSKTFSLRIKEEYVDFEGNAKIIGRVRKSGTTSIIAEFEQNIEILERKKKNEAQEEPIIETDNKEQETESESTEERKEIIRLGNREEAQKSFDTEKDSGESEEVAGQGMIIYESGSEKVKKYAIYVINLILVVIIAFLLISFKKDKILFKPGKMNEIKNGK